MLNSTSQNHLVALILVLLSTLAAPLAMADHDEEKHVSPRHVTVSGKAMLEAAPDYAQVRMGVAESRPTAKEARDAVAKVVSAFQTLCKELGVKAKDLSTTGVRVNPEYARQERSRTDEGPRIVAYRVSRELVVTLRDLEQLGPLIERSIALGTNQASPPTFAVADEARLQREALKLAAEDARARAEVLAATLNARLGPVREIIADGGHSQPPVERYQRARLASSGPGGGEETYDPGQIRIDVSVRVTFDLMPNNASS